MVKSNYKMGLSGAIKLVSSFSDDFLKLSESEVDQIPEEFTYEIPVYKELPWVEQSARIAALKEYSVEELKKVAVDTRKFNQETERNPRTSIQNWLRSEQFVDDNLRDKINIFAKLLAPLEELKTAYGDQPEWHESYSRVLLDHVTRILRVKEADLDIFKPQVSYLEQLLFARYRISMMELAKMNSRAIKESVLKKDEALTKKSMYLALTDSENRASEKRGNSTPSQPIIIKDSDGKLNQENIINALFGGGGEFRKPGERSATRTITITITETAN